MRFNKSFYGKTFVVLTGLSIALRWIFDDVDAIYVFLNVVAVTSLIVYFIKK